MTNKPVYFIGAGPGDPELLTIKGRRLIDEADIIIYAGSLVNPALFDDVKPAAAIYDSASMTLDEVLTVIKQGVEEQKRVVRVHTGDPSLYGAIREQIDSLEEAGIDCAVVPGVSSFAASAAALNREFTLPDVSQTLICTRMEGRTPVPETEKLDDLASHRASMAIFLSVGMIDQVVERLTVHYPPETPAAVVMRASWPDQKIVCATLATLADKVREAGIKKTAQILVGDFLGDRYELSKLYDPGFSHEYRNAK